ncbi:MAG TPA: STAS domain-containing protein [Candidatus Hydrogenedentes bacterium]|nr:STAS domain-containing protein [Candidatus Hydrogenedentota bacterium]HPU96432.1 STAS domain-containing protein [Candidatus Hydrogenedentota bacterium]
MSQISTDVSGNTATIRVSVAIDGDVAEQMKTAFSALPLDKIKLLVLDFSAVPFIGSAGLGKLLLFYKRVSSNGGAIEVRGASRELQELFQELRLDLLFKIV